MLIIKELMLLYLGFIRGYFIHLNNKNMGLDMRPMGKPKKGFEKRFVQIFNIIKGIEQQELSSFDKLQGKKLKTKKELLEEWFENQIPSYETIKAPMVGRDMDAHKWITERYEETEKEMPLDEFIKAHHGYYVIELATEKEGVPVYMSIMQDRNVFRGAFLNDCVDLIGEDLVSEAWESKLSSDALDYGNRLMNIANKIAKEHDMEYLRNQRVPPRSGENNMVNQLHIVFSLAKWLIFYGENGHGYGADF
ncbi:MAG: hypothetical protein ACPG49_11765 [Chitinophagales bacterium]